MNPPIYIIDGARTPFLKARNAPGPFAAGDLATAAGSALLAVSALTMYLLNTGYKLRG